MTNLNRDRKIEHWDAEDVEAWEAGGDKVAKRNLIWSIFAEHVGFSVWSIWSVMVLFMPQNVYHIDAAGKFYLVAAYYMHLHFDSRVFTALFMFPLWLAMLIVASLMLLFLYLSHHLVT